ncbi:MAG: hypothetical protein ABSG67_04085 [Thermoguttaceae bacterium]
MQAADAELGVSLHDGASSDLGFTAKRWIPKQDCKIAHKRHVLQERILRQFCPDVSRDICDLCELRERVAAGLAELVRSCRFLFGDHQYELDFAQGHFTAKNGVLRDLFIGIRLFIDEISGLEDLAAMLRDSSMFQDAIKM